MKLRQEIMLLFENKLKNIEFEVPKKWDTFSLKQKYSIIMIKTNIQSEYLVLFQKEYPEMKLIDCQETRKLLKNTVNDLQPWSPDKLEIKSKNINYFLKHKKSCNVDYIAFQVFGCEYSQDIDVAVLVEDHLQLTKNINIKRLHDELKELEYDISRGVDINVLYCENGKVMGSTKGTNEIQNILYLTYDLHKQKYPLFVSGLTCVNKENKISSVAKFILDNLKILIGNDEYQKERTNRRKAYAGKWNRVIYVLSMIDKIQKNNINLTLDCFKTITMKIIQLILLYRNDFSYRKYELARKFDEIYPGHYEHVVWLLMRGNDGSYDPKTIDLLFSEFKRIASRIEMDEPKWIKLDMDLNHNPTYLSEDLFKEFVKSPLIPTNQFIDGFEKICPTRNINSFIISSHNGDLLPPQVKEKAICIDQRSPEWIRLLTFYSCGRNTGVIKYDGADWVNYYYNLIRGAIIELMVIETCDFSPLIPNYEKITVGFLVEEVGKQGSHCIAPDLLLLTRDESQKVIPVEIKCLVGHLSDNHNYRRDFSLAKKQLESSLKILKIPFESNSKGIIIFVYVNDDGITTYGTIINF